MTSAAEPAKIRARSQPLAPRHSAASPLAAQVHDRLRADILLARLRPGEVLSENQQAQRLGVSRTPVREAIQRLVREVVVDDAPLRTLLTLPDQLTGPHSPGRAAWEALAPKVRGD